MNVQSKLLGVFVLVGACQFCHPETHPANALAPSVSSNAPHRPGNLPVLFIIGDSTVHNSSGDLRGWGDMVGEFFDTNRIVIQNHAKGGRSSRTFRTQGWWSNVLAIAKSGDFVVIQFGHNDAGPLDDTNRARGTLPGTGEEQVEIYNPIMRQKEVVHTYGWYLRQYIREAKQVGMIPIVCSPVPRVPRKPVEAENFETNQYRGWASEVAKQEGAFFVDLYGIIMRKWDGMTPEQIKALYFTTNDNTHTSIAGATFNAKAFVEGVRNLEDCPLRRYLKEAKSEPSD